MHFCLFTCSIQVVKHCDSDVSVVLLQLATYLDKIAKQLVYSCQLVG